MKVVSLVFNVNEKKKEIIASSFDVISETEKHYIISKNLSETLLSKDSINKMNFQNTEGFGFLVDGFIVEGEENLNKAINHIKATIEQKIKEILASKDYLENQLKKPDLIQRY